jgi:putative oxidoreductase
MRRWLLATEDDVSLLILRVVLGAVMLPHGAQHLFGWFGGPGLSGTTRFFAEVLGLPSVVVAFTVVAELVGGAALVVGALGRLAATAIGVLMVGAAVSVHLPHGFFMNWFGNQKGEGWEYHLLALAMSVAIVHNGSGAWSVDAVIARRAPSRDPAWPDKERAHEDSIVSR